jgi:hypothetical protein
MAPASPETVPEPHPAKKGVEAMSAVAPRSDIPNRGNREARCVLCCMIPRVVPDVVERVEVSKEGDGQRVRKHEIVSFGRMIWRG